MAEVDKGLRPTAGEAKFRTHSFKLSLDEDAAFLAAVMSSGRTKTSYIKARLFAHPVKDRSLLLVVAGLHDVGRRLQAITLQTMHGATSAEADSLLAEVRALIRQVAADLG